MVTVLTSSGSAPRPDAGPDCGTGHGALRLVTEQVTRGYSPAQRRLLEKLNRMDAVTLSKRKRVLAPERLDLDEKCYSPLPREFDYARRAKKFLLVDLTNQSFAAYERGRLVRWGPVSSGMRSSVTPPGLYFLSWKTQGRSSTVRPNWYLPWYFNFYNEKGLAFHVATLPGRPASHKCLRLLQRDAEWLHGWGDSWKLDRDGSILSLGTPVLVRGQYDFTTPR